MVENSKVEPRSNQAVAAIPLPVMMPLSDIPAAPASLAAKGVVRFGSTKVPGEGGGPDRLIGIYERAGGSAYARVQYSYAGRFSSQVDVIEASDYMLAFLLAASGSPAGEG